MLTNIFKNAIGMDFVFVPAGTFYMGSNESPLSLVRDFPEYNSDRLAAFTDESPLHIVTITKPFKMGKYPVTVGQFKQFLNDSGYMPESIADGTGGYGVDLQTTQIKTEDKEVFEGRNPAYSWSHTGYPQGDDYPVVNVT